MYKKYGVYNNKLSTFTCEGASGMKQMASIMASLRENPPVNIADKKVIAVADYDKSEKKDTTTLEITKIDLPKSDVITFYLEGDTSVIIRPSGTEPKIKVYYSTKGATHHEAEEIYLQLQKSFIKVLGF